MRNERLRWLLLSAIFAAVTAVLSQVTIPLPLIPITAQTLAVGLTATILGSRYGTLALLIYVLLGAVGLPVFTEASGGVQVLVGKTGGYIFGFIATAFVTGWYLEKMGFTLKSAVIANVIGMFVTLAFGTVQLKFVLDIPWDKAVAFGATPFLVVGVIKAVLAAVIGIKVRERLIAFRLLRTEQPVAR
ncbi:biotin transporter BioY [Brevibacillus sp. FSL K6-0770]|uniref:biotin transporter BioY n=1 Tax=Brevibacillus TaxID=55080 RepID=UPI000EEAD1C1|nr:MULTISPECIES: biotin transporter BioY [Brevibacillus]MDH6352332.1 biotin transport system substrate-specific component [Brevibacillus sp. 1238]MDR5000058.1 biotin transporter BioY [Brevibacillus parabrevis]MED1725439.1 biotin transporter BioY [Brevibacillus parabrevis]HBZ80725.1 BioY family transporter [Brevibacillus sp.]